MIASLQTAPAVHNLGRAPLPAVATLAPVPTENQLLTLLTDNHWLPDERFLTGLMTFRELGMDPLDLDLLLYDIQMRWGFCFYGAITTRHTWTTLLFLLEQGHDYNAKTWERAEWDDR